MPIADKSPVRKLSRNRHCFACPIKRNADFNLFDRIIKLKRTVRDFHFAISQTVSVNADCHTVVKSQFIICPEGFRLVGNQFDRQVKVCFVVPFFNKISGLAADIAFCRKKRGVINNRHCQKLAVSGIAQRPAVQFFIVGVQHGQRPVGVDNKQVGGVFFKTCLADVKRTGPAHQGIGQLGQIPRLIFLFVVGIGNRRDGLRDTGLCLGNVDNGSVQLNRPNFRTGHVGLLFGNSIRRRQNAFRYRKNAFVGGYEKLV